MERNIPSRVLESVERLIRAVSGRFKIEDAYIFGSYVKGTWLKTSDVDLIVVSRDFEGMDYMKRLDIINEVAWREGIRPHVEVIPLTPDELQRRKRSSAVIRDAAKDWVRSGCR